MVNSIPFGDPGLFDEFLQNLDVAAFETPLLRVGKVVPWEQFEPELHAAVLPAQPKAPGGRPRFAPLLMFKVLVPLGHELGAEWLQALHGLADDAVSFQITDRHSFRAFLRVDAGRPGARRPDDCRLPCGAHRGGQFRAAFRGGFSPTSSSATASRWPRRA